MKTIDNFYFSHFNGAKMTETHLERREITKDAEKRDTDLEKS